MERHESLTSQGTLQWDINNLVRELRQERLFVSSEQHELQSLNEQVVNDSQSLAQAAWVAAQQRFNLNKLILSRPDSTPSACCQRANFLESTRFIDAYKVLPYQDCLVYGDFLQTLRVSPELLAQCLVLGEHIAGSQLVAVVPSIISGLYGNLIMPHDTVLVLRLLRKLIQLQLVESDNPQRILQHGSCSFTRLYSTFHEALFSAKLFLTAALKAPILKLLVDIEYFLDIDPDKALVRFQPADRLKKFGKEGTPEYAARVAHYRKWTIDSLFAISSRFILSLQENMHCFPAPLAWLIQQISTLLTKSGNFSVKEVNASVTDLVFTYFICPAMVNPEPYGITDAPISYISRFNLIQVAQIIQMLALIKYQDVDVKVKDLYNKFDKHCVSTLIDMILDGCLETLDDVPITLDSVELRGLSRSSAFFTESELYSLVTFLQTISQSFEQSSNDDSIEEAAAIITPASKVNCKGNIFTTHDQEKLHLLLCSLPSRTLNGVNKSPSVDNILKHKREANSPESFNKKSGILGKVSKQRITKTISLSANMLTITSTENNQSTNHNSNEEQQIKHSHASLSNSPSRPNSSGSDDSITASNPEVLIIPLNLPQTEMIGLLPEQKVLSMEPSNGFSPSTNLDSVTLTNNVDDLISEQDSEERDRITVDSNELGLSTGQEKRTRFSHSHDDGSIGNTSDNLEAISEAASNHSVASSLELENEDQNDNDNLSDMISANVSGRGTPNISGRDTPSSQVTEGEDQARQETRQPFLPPPQSLINKQIRSEIDDKFCKFEIKKLLEGDETVSIISDTWSTDVLASDSETVEASDRPQFMPPVSERSERERANVIELDGIETASESAWSTDVLASDSERMTEVDTDDTASVAPSDDTASVARSDDTARSEIEETLPSHVHRPIPISIPSTSRNTHVFGMNNSCNSDHGISHNIHSNNGLLSTSSSQPGSPLDITSSLNPFNTYTNHSNYNSLATPPNINYNLNNAFRPIREDRDLLAQISFSGRDGLVTQANVTGKGGRKSDYRRRTMEYVDNNMNNMLHSSIIPDSNSSATTSSTMRTEISEQTSLLRNSNGTITNTIRREAVMIDSNSISINGLEVFLEEKERKSITNSTNKSIEISAFKPTSVVNHSNGITSINKSTNDAINDINVTAATPVLLLSNRVNGLKISSDLPATTTNLSDSSISSLNSNLTITNSNLCNNSDTNKNSTTLDTASQQWNNITDSSHAKWLLNGAVPTTLISTNEVSTNNFSASSKGSQTIKTSNSVPPSVIKPSTSTGAIPKSISFDMTAEKGDKDMLDDDQKNKRGFFGKLKMGFKNRRGKSLRGAEDLNIRYELITDSDTPRFKRYSSVIEESNMRTNNTETSEDILAKYRRKPSVDTNTSESTASSSGSGSKSKNAENTNTIGVATKCEDDRWTIDHNNVEASFAFLDLKRKLRLVFSTAAEVYNSPFNFHGGSSLKTTNNIVGSELISFLRIQQAKAQNLRNWPLVALINETLRCVSLFDSTVCRKLLFALKQEHAKRIAYVNYLVHCRQELLASLAHLENVKTQITSDRELSTSYLVTVCVRMFLERRESLVLQFCDEFRNLTLADEKTDLLENFLQTLSTEMDRDANWRDASESQLELARIAIERTLIGRVYSYAMFPNGDGDISRDQVLQEHIRKLSKVITPNHKDLRIPKIFHYECPWPSAQDAISAISAYKTARDKVKCVMRCALSIMHLLSLAIERGAPTADDFTPVLVYVLIKANPPSLLSTIQYVDSFFNNRLAGEEQYWWTQFCSAVEFIKTMDYSE